MDGLHRCRIHLHSAPSATRRRHLLSAFLGSQQAALLQRPSWNATTRHLSPQYDTQRFLTAAVRSHSWQVKSLDDADAVLVVTPHDRLCTAARFHRDAAENINWLQAVLWVEALLLDDFMISRSRGWPMRDQPHKPILILARQDGNCLAPMKAVQVLFATAFDDLPPLVLPTARALRAKHTLAEATRWLERLMLLVETVAKSHIQARAGLLRAPTPFVLPDKPAWLVAEGGMAPNLDKRLPWEQRRLLFFAGHTPKLYLSKVRYKLWKQLHRDPRVTTSSYDINCTVGAYSACNLKGAELDTKDEDWFVRGFCQLHCGPNHLCTAPTSNTSTPSERLSKLRARFDFQCRAYRDVDYVSESDYMRRDSAAPMTRASYLAQAVTHRFCLVAMGDQDGTPKITETIAIGGAGGCLPVIVLPRTAATAQIGRVLPYAGWLDYCRVAWLVAAETAIAPGGMASVLRQLEGVTAAEAAERSRELGRVRDAFVWRQLNTSRSRTMQPSAADYVLSDVCERKRLYYDDSALVVPRYAGLPKVAGGQHERCMLARL